jgi:hypothetical protein
MNRKSMSTTVSAFSTSATLLTSREAKSVGMHWHHQQQERGHGCWKPPKYLVHPTRTSCLLTKTMAPPFIPLSPPTLLPQLPGPLEPCKLRLEVFIRDHLISGAYDYE